ncbi:hypothetical protein WJX73_004762 [Symbiochloris irregularis]|uniref:superoxide dismutase n=1 Tax=Symbiochloris irregularis TaxID=706552 RepID=A0AAW1PHZ4_9CHLO
MSSATTKILFRELLRLVETFPKSEDVFIKLPVRMTGWGGHMAFHDSLTDYHTKILSKILPEAQEAIEGLTSTRLSHAQLRAHIAAKFRAPIHNNSGDPDQLMQRQNQGFAALRELGSQHALARCTSNTTTKGILISVTSAYAGIRRASAFAAVTDTPEHLFHYRCTITNLGTQRAFLSGRHWIIRDSAGTIHAEVPHGSPGVVGMTPDLKPGAVFEYVSSSTLNTTQGSMQGSFQMAFIDDEAEALMSSQSALLGRQLPAASVPRPAQRRQQVAAKAQVGPVTLPDLPYDYSALEPYISGEIMELHHSRHHQTYVNGLNTALEKYADAEKKKDVAQLIALQSALKFNGGGHVNHSLFWQNLTPEKDYKPPSGDLESAIKKDFGSLDNLTAKFNPIAAAIQGSGWGWLAYNKDADRLVIASTANQDPLSTQGLTPLLGIDMWEHAFYLQYKNKKPDYLQAVWNVINWNFVAERLAQAKK